MQRLIRDGVAVNIVTLEGIDVVYDLLSLPEKESMPSPKGITITQEYSRETPNIILAIKKEEAKSLLKQKEGLSEEEATKLLLSHEFSTYTELRVFSRGQKLLSPHLFTTSLSPVEIRSQGKAEGIPRTMILRDLSIRRSRGREGKTPTHATNPKRTRKEKAFEKATVI